MSQERGAEHVLLSGQPDLAQRILELTGGQGVHVVYDGVGRDTWDLSRQVLKHGGLLVSFGNASGKVSRALMNPRSLAHIRTMYICNSAGVQSPKVVSVPCVY